MKEEDKTGIERNRPAEKGKRSDPDLRDESAAQPGVSTMSSSPSDDANQHLTKTASDDFRTIDDTSDKADPGFDDRLIKKDR